MWLHPCCGDKITIFIKSLSQECIHSNISISVRKMSYSMTLYLCLILVEGCLLGVSLFHGRVKSRLTG